jgi:hypothetical protein
VREAGGAVLTVGVDIEKITGLVHVSVRCLDGDTQRLSAFLAVLPLCNKSRTALPMYHTLNPFK